MKTKFQCPYDECNATFDTYGGLARHYSRIHKTDTNEIRQIYFNNGKTALCKCGCGEKVKWDYENKKFRDFRHGHYVRTTNGFYSPVGNKRSHETRKRRFAKGEISVWNKDKTYEELKGKKWADEFKTSISNNHERSEKISKSLKGKKKSKAHREKMCMQLAINREKRLTGRDMSKPERLMRDMLQQLGLDYKYQFKLDRYFYDFRIAETNIIIEVDGDFWHCNPNTKYANPITEEQVVNMRNDKIKNKLAQDKGYILLRVWEHDIINHPQSVLDDIAKHVSNMISV